MQTFSRNFAFFRDNELSENMQKQYEISRKNAKISQRKKSAKTIIVATINCNKKNFFEFPTLKFEKLNNIIINSFSFFHFFSQMFAFFLREIFSLFSRNFAFLISHLFAIQIKAKFHE